MGQLVRVSDETMAMYKSYCKSNQLSITNSVNKCIQYAIVCDYNNQKVPDDKKDDKKSSPKRGSLKIKRSH